MIDLSKGLTKQQAEDLLKLQIGASAMCKCPNCEGYLVVRKGYSKFLGCSNYPECRTMIEITIPVKTEIVRGNLHELTKVAFSDIPIDAIVEEGEYSYWEEDLTAMYPNGIHCGDDM